MYLRPGKVRVIHLAGGKIDRLAQGERAGVGGLVQRGIDDHRQCRHPLEGANVHGARIGQVAKESALIGCRADALVPLVDGRTTEAQRHGRRRAAVVLQRAEQGIARAHDAGCVGVVDIINRADEVVGTGVGTGAPSPSEVREIIALPRVPDNRVTDVCGGRATIVGCTDDAAGNVGEVSAFGGGVIGEGAVGDRDGAVEVVQSAICIQGDGAVGDRDGAVMVEQSAAHPVAGRCTAIGLVAGYGAVGEGDCASVVEDSTAHATAAAADVIAAVAGAKATVARMVANVVQPGKIAYLRKAIGPRRRRRIRRCRRPR